MLTIGRDKAAGFSVITGVIGSLIGFLCSSIVTLRHLKLRNSLTPFSIGELARHSLTASASSSSAMQNAVTGGKHRHDGRQIDGAHSESHKWMQALM